jgi:hypothetical protein
MTSALAESTAQITAQNKWYYHVGPFFFFFFFFLIPFSCT